MHTHKSRVSKTLACELLIASCVDDGGIYKYELYSDGELAQGEKIPMPSPMFMQIEGDKLWATLRAPFADSKNSAVAAYDKESGKRITEYISTLGEVACHLAVDGDDAYCANYVTGNIFATPDIVRTHEGHGPNPKRQERAHVHCAFFSPDKKYILCCDLGIDKIFVYDRRLNKISETSVPASEGPRHLCFSKDGRYVYCLTEMGASICTYAYDDGKLSFISQTDVKPQSFNGQGKGSAIVLSADGKRLYAVERGSETVALFDVDGEKLTLVCHCNVHGHEPRDFMLVADESFAICCNQFSDDIAVFKVCENGVLSYINNFPLPTPICVIKNT